MNNARVGSSKADGLDDCGRAIYINALHALLQSGHLDSSMRVLVACGDVADCNVVLGAGLTNCVISNLDERQNPDQFSPLDWMFEDVESLTLADNSVDFCIVHEGLHHCRSPHRGMAELLRVARRGILIIEPADTLLTSIGVTLGFGQEYEHAAVAAHNLKFGGVRNSPIANFVYRLSPREVRKTLRCAAPEARLEFRFEHHFRIPWTQLLSGRSRAAAAVLRILEPLSRIAHWVAPGVVSNQLVAVALKPDEPGLLQPWLLRRDGGEITVNRDWYRENSLIDTRG